MEDYLTSQSRQWSQVTLFLVFLEQSMRLLLLTKIAPQILKMVVP